MGRSTSWPPRGESRRRRTALSWRGEAVPVRWLGLRHHPEFGATASWTGVKREAPGSSLLGELVDGEPARAWEYVRWRHLAMGRIRSGAVGHRRDRHRPDRRRPRAARVHRGRFARRREHPLERCRRASSERIAPSTTDGWYSAGYASMRRAPAAQLPGLRRSACADRLGASMERRQRRPPSPDGEVGVTIAAVGSVLRQRTARTSSTTVEGSAHEGDPRGAADQAERAHHPAPRRTDRRQYNLPQVVNLANVPENYT